MSKKDKRIKGCPNANCPEHVNKKYAADDYFCKKCGMPLIYVCAICHKEIEDIYGHRLCMDCEAAQKDDGGKIAHAAKNAGKEVKKKAIKGAVKVKENAPVAVEKAKEIAKNKKAQKVAVIAADAAADAVKNPKAKKVVKNVIKVVK